MKTAYKARRVENSMREILSIAYCFLGVLTLFAMLFLPLAPLFANEVISDDVAREVEDAVSEEVVENSTDEQEPNLNDEPTATIHEDEVTLQDAAEQSDETDEIAPTEEIVNSDDLVTHDGETLDDLEDSPEVVPEVTDITGEEELATSAEFTETETAEHLEDTTVSTEDVLGVATSTLEADASEDEIIETPIPEAVVETEVIPEINFVNTVTNDDNRFTFAKDECTLVGDGSFYCAKPTMTAEVSYTDRVFSAPDSDGDREIFIERDGVLSQITHNQNEDDAPYYDEISNTLVWHRLVDGRYQIMVLDMENGDEKQITRDRYNNMQPNAYDGKLVWQGWVGNDWEIFMFEDEDLVMLTDNTIHDVSPKINGDHIIWQSFESGAWVMKVYDIRTKVTETVVGGDGTSIENPRFVLVYDTKHESGDVETRGYDLTTGEVIALSSSPAPTPIDIPDPDQTGEDRALVSPNTQTKLRDVVDETDTSSIDSDIPENTVTERDAMDIYISPYSEMTAETGESYGTSHIPEVILDVDEILTDDEVEQLVPDLIIPTLESVSEEIMGEGNPQD